MGLNFKNYLNCKFNLIHGSHPLSKKKEENRFFKRETIIKHCMILQLVMKIMRALRTQPIWKERKIKCYTHPTAAGAIVGVPFFFKTMSLMFRCTFSLRCGGTDCKQNRLNASNSRSSSSISPSSRSMSFGSNTLSANGHKHTHFWRFTFSILL